MQKIKDFAVTDFTGGVVNKSDYQMRNNEVKRSVNFDLDEVGRVRRRRGIQQMGQQINSAQRVLASTAATFHPTTGMQVYHLVATDVADGTTGLYRLVGNYLTVAAAVADTTLTVASNALLAASGTVEINGDSIAYTGKSGTTGLTGVTGIARAHPAFSMVNQFETISATISGVNPRGGIYFSYLNQRIILNASENSNLYEPTGGLAAISGEADGVFGTNFRNRIYVAGAGRSGTNSLGFRVSYSNAGTAATWTTGTDYFDVEDDQGEPVTGFAVLNDRLGIFKSNSIWTYDEVELKQRFEGAGAYTHNVIKQIGNLVYTFGPTGVWVTNLFSATEISKPIEPYIKGFNPTYTRSGFGRDTVNCFAGVFDNKYYLYIGDITEPETLSDVVLVYDTIHKNWTVYSGFTDFSHFAAFPAWHADFNVNTAGVSVNQKREGFFGGDTGGKYFRLFEDRFIDNQTTQTSRGGDLTADTFSTTRTAISAELETKFYDLGNPQWWKEFGFLTVLVERGDFNVSYRIDKGRGVYTDWKTIGNFKASSDRVRIADEGYRIAFKFTTATADLTPILNGFILEDAIAKRRRV